MANSKENFDNIIELQKKLYKNPNQQINLDARFVADFIEAIQYSPQASTTGWADYVDTQYTSGSPLALLADTDTIVPNNAGGGVTSQTPDDISSFVTVVPSGSGYDHSLINGVNGQGLLITLNCTVVPTNVATTYIEFWLDIGGAVGELYRRIVSFPKGNGVARPITLTTAVYTLDTWEANGATMYVNSNNTANIYDVRYVIHRIHKVKDI